MLLFCFFHLPGVKALFFSLSLAEFYSFSAVIGLVAVILLELTVFFLQIHGVFIALKGLA